MITQGAIVLPVVTRGITEGVRGSVDLIARLFSRTHAIFLRCSS